jgi:hypothetical protein
MNVRVLKNDQLKVLVVPFLPLTLLVYDEKVCQLTLIIEAQFGSINRLNSFNLRMLLLL